MHKLILIKENRLISYLRDISRPVRIVISFGVLMIAFLVWARFFYLPVRKEAKQFRVDIEVLRQEKISAKKLENKIVLLRDENRELETVLIQKNNSLNKVRLNTVFDLMHDNKLLCVKFVKDDVSKGLYTLAFNGAYDGIVAFFDTIKKKQLLLDIKSFSLIALGDSQLNFIGQIRIPR